MGQCCGAGTFWPEPVWRSGSGLDEEKIRNAFLLLLVNIDTLIKGKLKPDQFTSLEFPSLGAPGVHPSLTQGYPIG